MTTVVQVNVRKDLIALRSGPSGTDPAAPPAVIGPTAWRALLVAMTAYASVQLGLSPVSSILPTLAAYFRVDVELGSWILTAYLLALTTLILPAGRLGDRLGHRRVVLGGLAAYAVASLAAVLSSGLTAMLVFRVLQGLASSFILGPCMALATQAFPAGYRGRVVGAVTLASSVGSAAGVYLAAWAITYASWRLIFVVMMVPAVVALLVGLTLPDPPRPRTPRAPVDWLGAALLAGALVAFSLSLNHLHAGPETFAGGWHWHLPGHAVAAVLLGLFVWAQRRAADPLIPPAYLRNAPFVTALGANFVLHLTMMGSMATVPFVVQLELGLSPAYTAGVITVMQFLSVTMAPISGWLYDRTDSRVLLPGALVLLGLAMFLVGLRAGHMTYPHLLVLMAGIGTGMGLFLTANNAAVMGSVPADLRGFASGMIETTRQLGHGLATAAVGGMISAGVAAANTAAGPVLLAGAFRSAWWLMAGITTAGVVLCVWHIVARTRPAGPTAAAAPAGDRDIGLRPVRASGQQAEAAEDDQDGAPLVADHAQR